MFVPFADVFLLVMEEEAIGQFMYIIFHVDFCALFVIRIIHIALQAKGCIDPSRLFLDEQELKQPVS